MRPLGGDAGSASPDGHRPRLLPVELQPAAGRWALAEPKPPAHVWACGVLLPPTAAVLGFSPAICPAAACTRVSSPCTATETETENIVLAWLCRDPDPHAAASAALRRTVIMFS